LSLDILVMHYLVAMSARLLLLLNDDILIKEFIKYW